MTNSEFVHSYYNDIVFLFYFFITMNIEIRQKDERTSWEELTELFHASFQERLDQGLQFTCSYFTPEDLEKRCADAVVLLAIDKDKDRLAGTASIVINHDENGTWGYIQNLAIHPDYKRRGVGTKLEKRRTDIAIENGCRYLIGDTAIGAKSSVKLRKKSGFRIVGLDSFKSTNYYSYIFRKQLVHDPKWSNPVYCKLQYLKSAIQCRMYHLENGEDRKSKWLDFYLWLRGVK